MQGKASDGLLKTCETKRQLVNETNVDIAVASTTNHFRLMMFWPCHTRRRPQRNETL